MNNSKNIKVTIVTICFNSEKTLSKTIESVINQDYTYLEYIVIDGGSSDKTLEIINKYKSYISAFLSEPDEGIADAFNKGIKLSTGDLILFLNSDDFLSNNRVISDALKFYKNDNTILCGKINFINDTNKIKIFSSHPEKLHRGMYVRHPAVLTPKIIFDTIGNFDVSLTIAMDYEFMLRCKTMGINFLSIPIIFTNMLYGGASSNYNKAAVEELRIKNKYLGFSLISYFDFLFGLFVNNFLRKFLV